MSTPTEANATEEMDQVDALMAVQPAKIEEVVEALPLPDFVQEHVDALDQAEEDCAVLKDEVRVP